MKKIIFMMAVIWIILGTTLSRVKVINSFAQPEAGNVQLSGRLEYTANTRDGGGASPVTNPLARARIEIWDDTGSQPLGTTWANSSGEYLITVPNNEPGGIDPRLMIFATDKKNNPYDNRVNVVDSGDKNYFVETNIINGGNLSDGSYQFDYTIDTSPPFPHDSDTVQAFLLFDLMANASYNKMQSWVNWNETSSLKVIWPKVCVGLPGWLNPGSCYFYGTIYIHPVDGQFPDVIIHEYGHFALSRKVGDNQVVHACRGVGYNHTLFGKTDETCAWSEGWATFFQMAVQNDANFVGNKLDDVENHLPVLEADKYEFITSASLWDIYDPYPPNATPEPWDEFNDDFNGPNSNGIWHFSTSNIPGSSNKPDRISSFWISSWFVNRLPGSCYGSFILKHHSLTYPPEAFSLMTSINPLNSGSISIHPVYNCPQDTYQKDALVHLGATPAPGYAFSRWYLSPLGGINPNPEIDVTINTFAKISWKK